MVSQDCSDSTGKSSPSGVLPWELFPDQTFLVWESPAAQCLLFGLELFVSEETVSHLLCTVCHLALVQKFRPVKNHHSEFTYAGPVFVSLSLFFL